MKSMRVNFELLDAFRMHVCKVGGNRHQPRARRIDLDRGDVVSVSSQ